MISISKIALSAAVILGSASAALADQVPESRVSGIQAPVTMTAVHHFVGGTQRGYEVPEIRVSGFQAPVTMTAVRHFVGGAQRGYEVPESRVSGIQSVAGTKVAVYRHITTANQVADDAEYRIGDRYPALAHINAATAAKNAGINRVAYEGPENQNGDRYAPAAVKFAANRMASNVNRVAYEGPENQIADKFPLLARTSTQRGMAGLITISRTHKQAQKQTAKNKV